MAKHILVVGAGLGGLATALRLAHRGHRVTVLEKTDQVGGRNRREWVEDCRFDGGPTLLMMLDPFEKLFRDVGEDFQKVLPITLCDPSYRVFYSDGIQIDGTPNMARMLQEIERVSGPKDARAYPEFIGRIAALYDASIPNFVRNNFQGLGSFASPRQLARVLKHKMLSNLAKQVERTFDNERLRMLFSFQTMYLGLSPYDAPWVYSTLAYMEYGQGIWYPKGGLPTISEAVAEHAVKRGAEIRLKSPVQSVNPTSVTLESGEVIKADAVVVNADLPYARKQLARKPPKKPWRNSCSAYVLYLKVRGDLPKLLHHNVFFGRDFKGNLDALFHSPRLVEDPAFYACVSKRSDASAAPEGYMNLYLLIPCPNQKFPFDEAQRQHLRDQVFNRLDNEVGFDPEDIVAEKSRDPNTWQSELNLHEGAAFGLSADTFQSAFMRPQNTHDGVYYVGASTIPGNGLPMVLISAELVEDRLRRAIDS
ncbi:MAG TPA: phytoene desaturase family protein [Fimbriimonadaceae bacterium]|nr:phytoene desaturase family protein [Fimbriimonadaceae bacterium]